jgi:hypothetical protein
MISLNLYFPKIQKIYYHSSDSDFIRRFSFFPFQFLLFTRTIMFKKILILSAAVGAGHLRAAQALEKALLEQNAAAEIRNIDVLTFTTRCFEGFTAKPISIWSTECRKF